MIENEEQLKITQAQADLIVASINDLKTQTDGDANEHALRLLELQGLESLLLDLFSDIIVYIVRTSGKKQP